MTERHAKVAKAGHLRRCSHFDDYPPGEPRPACDCGADPKLAYRSSAISQYARKQREAVREAAVKLAETVEQTGDILREDIAEAIRNLDVSEEMETP